MRPSRILPLKNQDMFAHYQLFRIKCFALLDGDSWVPQRWYKIVLHWVTWDEDFKIAMADVSSLIRCNVANTVFTSGKSLPRLPSRVCYVSDEFGVVCRRGCCPYDSGWRGTPVSSFEDIRRAVWKSWSWNVFGLKKIREEKSADREKNYLERKKKQQWWNALHKV